MEEDNIPLSSRKVKDEFERRARSHGDMNAVLDACSKPGVSHMNVLRDYLTRKSLFCLLKPGKNDSVLDFGCGVGRLTASLSKKAGKICGVDVSPAMLEIAEKEATSNRNAEFRLISGNVIPYPENCFDKAFTIWVLQHVDDDELAKIAGEIYRVLAPDGIAVILEQTRKEKTVLSDIHIHRKPSDYEEIFRKTGFKIIKSRAIMRIPSYTMSLWNRKKSPAKCLLPALLCLEYLTLHYKEYNVEYFTWSFVLKKTKLKWK